MTVYSSKAAQRRHPTTRAVLAGLMASALAVALPSVAGAQSTGTGPSGGSASGSVPAGAPATTTTTAQPQGPAAPTPAPTVSTTSTTGNRAEQYQRRIRQAITPDEVRRACAAPSGSLTVGNDIVVCAERDPQQRYRVPSEAARRAVDPAQDSPVAQARRIMDADHGAPIGAGADMTRPGSIAERGINIGNAVRTLRRAAETATEPEE